MRSLAVMDALVATPAIRASTSMPGHPALFGSLGALFLACVAATAVMCRSMLGGMTMPGGWTMSMTWMRMPGQSWLAAAGVFLGMPLRHQVNVLKRSVKHRPKLTPADRLLWLILSRVWSDWREKGVTSSSQNWKNGLELISKR